MEIKQKKSKSVFAAGSLAIFAVAIVATLSLWFFRDKSPRISFAEWVAVKPVKISNEALRFAIASMVSAEETWVTYKGLVEYVAEHVGVKASMILRPSYSDVRRLLEENKVDLAFVCTGTYITCSRAATVELIAVPEFKNDLKYRCLIVVNKNSTINDITDLQGRSFAFTDPESNTGCIVPSWFVRKQGKEPEAYFSKIIYTGSHDRSLQAVSKGLVDGAGIDSLVFYSFIETHPEMKDFLRVIWESEPFGAPPIVVPTGLPKSTKAQLRKIFLSMSQDVQGRVLLDGVGIERFRAPQPNEYSSAYDVWNAPQSRKRK